MLFILYSTLFCHRSLHIHPLQNRGDLCCKHSSFLSRETTADVGRLIDSYPFLFAWICHVVCQDSILTLNHNWTINCTERSKAHSLGQGGVIHQLFRHVWGGELTLDTSTNPSRPRFHMHFGVQSSRLHISSFNIQFVTHLRELKLCNLEVHFRPGFRWVCAGYDTWPI